MAASKNNPENRQKEKVILRQCEHCGHVGPIKVEVERAMLNRTLTWRCKDGKCKK